MPLQQCLGFYWRDFPDDPRLVFSTDVLQGYKFNCNRSIIKGTLRGEQSTFQAVSRLPLEEFL